MTAALLLPLLLSGLVHAAPPAQAPTAVSVTPSSGSGTSQTFTFQYSDGNGFADINNAQVIIGSGVTYQAGCVTYYHAPSQGLYLHQDTGPAWDGPITIGTAGTLQNTQCSINVGSSSASGASNTLTVNLAITFKAGFTGNKNIFGFVQDNGGLASGWQTLGSWTPASSSPPAAVSVTPNAGSGTSQTFSFQYSDPDGFADINNAQAIIGSGVTYQTGCVAYYHRPSQGLYLHQDSGPAWDGPITIGTAGTLQNSQCSINVGSSSASGASNTLTVNLAITFKAGFTGNKNIFGFVQDNGGLSSGWQTLGAWAPTNSSPPVAVSVTPSSGSGASQTFSFQYSDPDGFADINNAQSIFNSGVTYQAGCVTYYHAPSHGLFLHQDSGPAWDGPIPIGTAGTLQNSQCSINVGSSSASGASNTLTVNLAITFLPAFVGTRSIFMYAADRGGQASDWQARGSWTVPLFVSVSPGSASLLPGATQQFTATVTGGANSVTWSVNDVAGGNSTVGIITTTGLYTAPAALPTPNPVTVKATSMVDTSRSGSSLVTINNSTPSINSISPTTVNAGGGNTTLTVNGSGFSPQSTVKLSSTSLTTTYVNSGQLTAVVPAASLTTAGTFAVTVFTPAPGGGTSNSNNLQVLLVVAVSPSSASAFTGGTQQFTSTVTGGANTVTWLVNDVVGGNATVGTIDGSGLYTAPAAPPTPNLVTVKATSTVDSNRSGSASVTITNAAPSISSISPTAVNAGSGNTTLTVNGSGISSQSTVKVGSTSLTTTFVNAGQLTAVVPSSSLTSAATLAISVTTPAPGGGTSNSVNLTVVLVVAVSPASANLQSGGTQQFTATVTGGASTVTWSVNDVAGGNSSVGTITSGGLYTAPAVPPTPNPVTVKATSTVDTSRSGSSSVTAGNPTPSISSLSPSSIPAISGDTVLTVNGSSFLATSVVELSGLSLTTTYLSSSQLTATIPASMLQNPGTVPITVRTPAPGGVVSSPRNLTIAEAVTVSPSTRTVPVNWTRLFAATVTGEANQSVTWMVNDVPGGSAATGTITAAGIYISPSTVPGSNVVTVKAVSVANPSKYGTGVVTITLPVSDNYPRNDPSSILDTAPALAQVPLQGTIAAVLDWTAKDSSAANEEVSKPEEVLAVCHSLNEMGIPHIHTTDWNVAKTYTMVAVVGVLEQNSLTSTERSSLATYVQNGGTILLWRPADSNLLSSLGVTASTTFSGTDKRQVTFNVQTGDGVVRYIDDDVEVHWQMEYWSMGTTREYTTGSATAIATWDSGKAAIARSNLGTGRAYMFGWRLKNVLADAELQNIPTTPEPQWVNTQVLDADIARLMVRGIYETLPSSPHVRQMAPNGKPAALILTHDVDAKVSYDNLPDYLALENAQGVKSTYLFTTAAYDSGWVETMYTASGKANIQSAIDQGFDIQSHSFDHYHDFDHAPYGTGNENAANYLPHYSADLGYTINSSALGELGVSRWLLRHDFGVEIPAFRSGYLLMPQGFLDAVQATGYRRDSTYAAGISRGFTPFVPFKMVSGAPVTYRFVEYPMGLEDRNLDATNVTQIVDSWERVIRTNYKNGVPTVINIHPVNQPRIDAMQLLFQRISDLDIWIGDWKTFGDFWESQGMTCSRWP